MSMRQSVPTAHYPPMSSSRFTSMQLSSIRSSSTTANNSPSAEEKPRILQQVCFCDYDRLAVINCHVHQTDQSRKAGPILLEWKHIQYHHGFSTNDEGENKNDAAAGTNVNENSTQSLFDIRTTRQSRGNPSLGSSVNSTCLDVYSHNCAVTGLSTGALCLHGTDAVEYYHLPRNHRPATAVACHHGQVALGLTETSSASNSTVTSGPAPLRQAAADRDYGAFVWELPRKTPLYKLSHQLGVTALEWCSRLLVVGNRHQWQCHDLRQRQPVSIVATKVSHLTATAPHTVVTSHKSVVQVWDTRQLTGTVHEIIPKHNVLKLRLVPDDDDLHILTVEGGIQVYNLTSNRPVHTRSITPHNPASGSFLDFALYPSLHTNPWNSSGGNVLPTLNHNQGAVSELFTNRHVVISEKDMKVDTVAQLPLAPLAWSQRQLVHGVGRTLWAAPSPKQATGDNDDDNWTWKCVWQPIHNIRLLQKRREAFGTLSPVDQSLLRLWTWLERTEEMCHEEGKTLLESGRVTLAEATTEMQAYCEELSCDVYESQDRRAALTACGWAGKYDLFNVLGQCEAAGDYERAAALAVWHGDLAAAVDSLQRGAAADASAPYAEFLQRVALSMAGFGASSTIWRRTTAQLLQRPEFVTRAAYIRSALNFLLSIGTGQPPEVMHDHALSLSDRLAFCCRFSPKGELKKFLEKCISDCKESGDIEGLTVAGISKDGIEILQSYMDHSADVPTAALITSRVILPPEWTTERRICAEWLHSYRSLLNSGQRWQFRAMFDVDRSDYLRRVKARSAKPMVANARRNLLRRSKPLDSDLHVPSQLEVRCNYCNSSLGLRSNNPDGAWLSKVKPVLSCCPTCRKPLPRCSICMLSMGALNPFVELAKERGGGSLGSLPFAEWFTWCMRCKHGGHAHHLVGWFSKHEVCPVSDCDCRCQFDGLAQALDGSARNNKLRCTEVPKE